MCGIFGYVGKKSDAANIVLDGLKRLEYRGYDSWGVAVTPQMENGVIKIKKKAGKIGNATVTDLPSSQLSFGHTRWATHGGVTDANAHPHLDCTRKIAVVHNGIFENYLQFKTKLQKSGHSFRSETDTEVLAHLIEEYLKKLPFAEAVKKAFNQMEGANAVIVINTRDKQLVAAKNSSPLVLGFGTNENFLASDPSALLPHTKTVYFMEDGEQAIVTEFGINLYDIKSGKSKQLRKQKLLWKAQEAERGTYPYFMLKEIYEQPKVLQNIATLTESEVSKVVKIIKNARTTYLIACGSASYACLIGEHLFATIAGHLSRFVLCSEFHHLIPFLSKKDVVLAISQSGETIDTLEAVHKAQKQDASIIALVNVLGSALYRTADLKALIGAGPEKSVASTKALIGMIGNLILWTYALKGDFAAGKKTLHETVEASQIILNSRNVSQIKSLADKLKKEAHIYLIGRGISYVAALEGALKIKEISYIHAEGLAAGELKHGTLALIEPGTPCIVILQKDASYQDCLNAAAEVKARGAMIIGISPVRHEIFDEYIEVKDVGPATIIPTIIALQLLAYSLTIKRGLDPDMPRNLAKSVTVK